MKISDTPHFFYFFKTTPYLLPTAPYLYEEKSELPSPVPSYKRGGGIQLCFIFFKLRKQHSLIKKFLLHFLYKIVLAA